MIAIAIVFVVFAAAMGTVEIILAVRSWRAWGRELDRMGGV